MTKPDIAASPLSNTDATELPLQPEDLAALRNAPARHDLLVKVNTDDFFEDHAKLFRGNTPSPAYRPEAIAQRITRGEREPELTSLPEVAAFEHTAQLLIATLPQRDDLRWRMEYMPDDARATCRPPQWKFSQGGNYQTTLRLKDGVTPYDLPVRMEEHAYTRFMTTETTDPHYQRYAAGAAMKLGAYRSLVDYLKKQPHPSPLLDKLDSQLLELEIAAAKRVMQDAKMLHTHAPLPVEAFTQLMERTKQAYNAQWLEHACAPVAPGRSSL